MKAGTQDYEEKAGRACADVFLAECDVAETLLDPYDTAVALAVFKRALPDIHDHRPVMLSALVEMQLLAIDTARKVRFLFAQQQSLALNSERNCHGHASTRPFHP